VEKGKEVKSPYSYWPMIVEKGKKDWKPKTKSAI